MANLYKMRCLIFGATALLLLLEHQTEGNPTLTRRERLIAGLGLDYPQVEDVSNDIEDRTVRRSLGSDSYSRSTYPPIPPYPGDEDEWEIYQTSKPQTSPPLLTPTTETTTFIGRGNNYENVDDDNDEPFHRKVYPWIKRRWEHVSSFFRNQIG